MSLSDKLLALNLDRSEDDKKCQELKLEAAKNGVSFSETLFRDIPAENEDGRMLVDEDVKTRHSIKFNSLLEKIEKTKGCVDKSNHKSSEMIGTVESDPKYLTKTVESSMTFIAPNLCAIVGATTAAKLVEIADGLTKLSKIPACNVLVLGAEQKTLEGCSEVQMLPHTGFIYYSELVQSVPPDLRKKISKKVARKAILAARVDASHKSTEGIIGQNFHDDIEKKIDKLLQPAPVKLIKLLPKWLDAPKKKRGGKRMHHIRKRWKRKHIYPVESADSKDIAVSQTYIHTTQGAISKVSKRRFNAFWRALHANLQKRQKIHSNRCKETKWSSTLKCFVECCGYTTAKSED